MILHTRAITWARRQDWNPVRRARTWYEASEWHRMSGSDLAWHVGGWAISLFAALVVAVTYVSAFEMWPRWGTILTLAAVFAGGWTAVGYRQGNHAGERLRDQLDYAKQHWAAATDSYASDLLAEVGPITDPTPVVDDEAVTRG